MKLGFMGSTKPSLHSSFFMWIFLIVSLWATAATHALPRWSYASSDHFEVYTSGNEKHAREALADFERVHAFFESALGLPPDTEPRTRLIVFSSPKEFEP